MLTIVQIRALKPGERPFKAFDTDGLYLLVQPSGALLWRFATESSAWSENFRSVPLQMSRCSKRARSATMPSST